MKKENLIINKAKTELSEATFKLFSCVYLIIADKVDLKNIKISNESDWIRIELNSDSNEKLKLCIEFFSGLSDFFIDDVIEVFIQKRFSNIDKAEKFFRNFFYNSIRKDIYYSKEKVTKTKYYLINDSNEEFISGEINKVDIFKMHKSKKSILFKPWIAE